MEKPKGPMVSRRRKELKRKAIDYLGGTCILCGYNKCIEALTFHHRIRTAKSFTIGDGQTRSWERIQLELEKCCLLCHNCHDEVHAGIHTYEVLLAIGATGNPNGSVA